MTGIGHNGAPPHIGHSLHIEDMFALASGSTAAPVLTDEQESALDALLDDIREARKAADAQRVAEKKPYDDAGKAVQELWKPLLGRCDAASDAIKAAITPYRVAKQHAKDEAVCKAREEAMRREADAQAALKQSNDMEGRFAAEEDLKVARKLNAVANKAEQAPTGLRTVWTATIIDPREFLQWVMKRHSDHLKDWLADFAASRVRAGARVIPGVLIQDKKRAA